MVSLRIAFRTRDSGEADGAVQNLYGERAAEVLRLFPGSTADEVQDSATALAGLRFTAFSSWKWAEMQAATGGGKPVYRYFYSHPRPAMRPEMGDAVAGLAGGVITGAQAQANKEPAPRGAVHSADIEYAMGNLPTNKVYAWTPEDFKISELFQAYYANFVKAGDPNGHGLPAWPAIKSGGPVEVLHLEVESKVEPEAHRDRYLFFDELAAKPAR